MVINSPDKHVLTVGFASFAKGAEAGADWGLVAAGALLVCIPIMILFIAFQKTFISSFGFGELK
jgi:sn-glycerol 3-phosphate transport system permease protein